MSLDLHKINLDDLEKFSTGHRSGGAVADMFYGINSIYSQSPLPPADNNRGYVFFTRPQLRLDNYNIKKNRIFKLLMDNTNTSNNKNSIARGIRMLLDPMLENGFTIDSKIGFSGIDTVKIKSSIIDNKNPWLTVLSNSLIDFSGFPDKVSPTHTSAENIYKGVYEVFDGIADIHYPVSMSPTFRNSIGEPALKLLYYLSIYPGELRQARLKPYPTAIAGRWCDHNIRVFRILTAPDDIRISGIASPGPGLVKSVTYGNRFNYNINSEYSEENKEFSADMVFTGLEYDKEILLHEFNTITGYFNSDMKDPYTNMARVHPSIRKVFNNRCYPYCNMFKYTLEWYTDKDYFETTLNELLQVGLIDNADRTLYREFAKH